MSLVFNTKTYTQDTISGNVATYFGPDRAVGKKDNCQLRREEAKASATFSGFSKGAAKLTRTMSLTDAKTPTADNSIEFSCKIAVGTPEADVAELFADAAALAAHAAFAATAKGIINQG